MNDKELQFILKQGEGQFIEFKEKLDKSFSKEITAFANSKGGKIYFGITDKGDMKGFVLTNDVKSKIIDIAQNCDPKVIIDIKSYEDIACVEVFESQNKPHSCSSGFYLRIGANSQKLTRDEIFKFAISEGRKTFDEELNAQFIYPEDFDETKLDDYLIEAGLTKNIDTTSILINLGVARKRDGKFMLNNAGVLFFAKEPSRFFLSSKVVCGEFAGNDKVEILDKKIYDDGILNNIKQSINFIKKRIKVRFIIKTARRKEIPQFPEAAFREAVVNSIMHRDYYDKTSDTFVEAYRNMITIYNPGGLVHWLKPEDFGKMSKTRNPIIASLLSKTIYVEKMGTGIRRIQDSIKAAKLPEPEFKYNEYRFCITIKDETFLQKKDEHDKIQNFDDSKPNKKLLSNEILPTSPKEKKRTAQEKILDLGKQLARHIRYQKTGFTKCF